MAGMQGLLWLMLLILNLILLFSLPYFYHELGVQAQQFEMESRSESRLAKGRDKLKELQRDAENSPCWREVLEALNSTCRDLTDVKQTRLALIFTNCHLEKSGRETFPCTEEMSIKECTSVSRMGDFAFGIYTQFYTHANNLCYFIQSRLWQEQTESTVNKLSQTSQEAVSKLEKSLEYHRELDSKQSQALKNQETILDQDHMIAESLETTKNKMDKAFQEMSEKAEKQKFVLEEMLTKLLTGMSNVQWLLSLMLGEFITLETGGFFAVVFFVVTFAPQFGYSRLWLYSLLVGYAVCESAVRRTVIWWTSNRTADVGLVSQITGTKNELLQRTYCTCI